jgi:hypothetical protein
VASWVGGVDEGQGSRGEKRRRRPEIVGGAKAREDFPGTFDGRGTNEASRDVIF